MGKQDWGDLRINGDKVMVEFGKHDFVEFYSDELVAMTML